MPDNKGIFCLYFDTSKFTTRSALYQIQNGQSRLKSCCSKRMPKGVQNYSIPELEICALAINTTYFSHLLKRVCFDAIVDSLVLTDIIKNKSELTTNRIKRLLKVLSSYSFSIYYLKGKDMVLSGFQGWKEMRLNLMTLLSYNLILIPS